MDMAKDFVSTEFSSQIVAAIEQAAGVRLGTIELTSLAGGDINIAYRVRGGNHNYFMKTNSATRLPMFDAEAAALKEIAATKTVRVPLPICWGATEIHSYLVLEWLELQALDDDSAAQLGAQLAALHRQTATQFGWHRDNTIGATPQINNEEGDWLSFWKSQRLGYQLRLAERHGYGGKLQDMGAELMQCCDALFADYSPLPSLLHGDLWSGNAACDAAGEPVIYDPASYYGDREADVAMTELFGGFPAAFLRAYQAAWPMDDGYRLRRDFYNLYHLLNHLNLFGGGYLMQSQTLMQRLLAALK